MLIVFGKTDEILPSAGVVPYLRTFLLPRPMTNAGHFELAKNGPEMAELIRQVDRTSRASTSSALVLTHPCRQVV
jgi:hypothetical protein